MGQMIDEEDCEVCIPFDQEWIFTYGDLVTLLLCFFILFFALSTVDGEKAKRLASTFQEDTKKVENFNAYVSADEFIMLEKVKELLKNNVDPESIIEGKKQFILQLFMLTPGVDDGDLVYHETFDMKILIGF